MQQRQRIVILGGGISGLSLAWYLSKKTDCAITVLEKNEKPGGWIRSERVGDFFFERGPHTFSTSRSQLLLDLAKEVGMEGEILYSDDSAKKRFLYLDGRLQPLPKWSLIKALIHDWCTPMGSGEEESVYAFARRRFGEKMAHMLFDPMVIGIYAGDMHQLSLEACFPFFKRLEVEYGSVARGMLANFFKKKRSRSALFTFKDGVESFVQKIAQRLPCQIHYTQEAKALRFSSHHIEVQTEDRVWEADRLFCALPPKAAQGLFAPHDAEVGRGLEIPMEQVAVVNLGFKGLKLPFKGFGYLVPTSEQQQILGVIFDSLIFPAQNTHAEETRLSVLMRRNRDSCRVAQEAVAQHLRITDAPDAIASMEASIPQYTMGHAKRVTSLQKRMREKFPACTLVGNYLEGVSVNDCMRFTEKQI